MSANPSENANVGPSGPASRAIAVTPADSDLTLPFRGLYVGTTGNIKVTDLYGNAVTFNSVPVGFFPVGVTRVWSTGTTASNIVGLI